MNRIHRLFFAVIFTALAVISACDMTYLSQNPPVFSVTDDDGNDDGNGMTDEERDELERTGSYLKLTSMPLHTQSSNVFSVQVANSASPVAALDKNQSVRIFKEKNYSTVYLPLAYPDNSAFVENGSFYVAFVIHVDVISSYVINVTDKVLVSFTDGRGELDVKMLPYKGIVATDRRYLTIYNLPLNLLPQNVSKVSVNNRDGAVANCSDYSLVDVSTFGGSSTVSIPLSLVNSSRSPSAFSGTGSFYVAFDLFIDALTHYSVTAEDRLLVYFLDGNGYLDINALASEAAAQRRYLTITGLPSNIRPRHVSNVLIHNQTSPIARVENYNLIDVLPGQNNTFSARIPLCYISPPAVFSESGGYIIVFDINIDADTRFTVTAQDRVTVSFFDGNGSFDIANIPPPEHRYLTITDLPSNLLAHNVSNVIIHNQAGPVAQCESYELLDVSLSGGIASVRIPLSFISSSSMFTGTGIFIVTFNINIDADTSYIITANDNVKVSFTNGNGTFNINNIPEKVVPCLTIRNLPLNTTKNQISGVYVYNLAGTVASCNNNNNIVTFIENGRVTAKVPLSSSGNVYFLNTGVFYISFTVNVDIENQIVVSRSDNLSLSFVEGSATFDIFSTYGFFSAELTNPLDTAKPVIKSGAEFDIDGYRHKVSADLTVPTVPPVNYSGILYLYAYHIVTDVYYEFSSEVPSFNSAKNGYYNGFKRALWKMIYLEKENLFLFKTYIADNFSHFSEYILTADTFNVLTASKTSFYSLTGSSNPGITSITLPAGVYVARLNGAGGGGGYGSSETLSSKGGSGGNIDVVFTLGASVPFSAFTGSSGYRPAESPSFSGYLSVYGTVNIIRFRSDDYSEASWYLTSHSGSTPIIKGPFIIPIQPSTPSSGGGGGGGGGSGTFLYSAKGFFLCAGGGGGGSGQSLLTPGGAGGTGGVIGPGAGGGAGGYLQQPDGFSVIGSPGGKGGGLNGGLGGRCAGPTSNINGSDGLPLLLYGSDDNSFLFPTTASPTGMGAVSYSPSDFLVSPSAFPIFRFGPSAAVPSFTTGLHDSSVGFTCNYFFIFPSEVKSLSSVFPPVLNSTATSGNGGSTSSFLFGPNSWLNTNNVNGIGANSPPLNLPSFSENSPVIIFNNTGVPRFADYVSPLDSYYLLKDGRAYDLVANDFQNNLVISLTPEPGLNGLDGGNNRNANRGGGAQSDTAGSITIYKLY